MAKIWTEDNEEFIRETFRHKTYADLAEHFGVTQKAMESKIRRMGLKKQDYRDVDPGPALLPPLQPEPRRAPVETGPTPIKTARLLPRRVEERVETALERKSRLKAELEAAGVERTRREQDRDRDAAAKALKLFETGLAKYHDGALGKALEAFRKIIEASPPDPVLAPRARQYAQVLRRRGRSATFAPQNADDFYLMAVVALNDGNPTAALESLAEALSQAPGDDRILYCQAAALSQRGDIDAALDALRAAVDINDANRIFAVNDPDFVPLRVHEDFRLVVSSELI